MKLKVGIPRGMFYYDYHILWEEFFNSLGIDVIFSPKTNKDILNKGVHDCVDEACLPIKVFHGHVNYLRDKVDYIFIPKFISIYRREYCCPKHLGLPDMIKHSIDGLPKIIDTEINLRKSNKTLKSSIIYTGKYFTDNSKKILRAFDKAYNKYEKYKDLVNNKKISIEAIGKLGDINIKADNMFNIGKKNILLLGHPYNIYDDYINMNIMKKLKKQWINVTTVEMLDRQDIRRYASELPKRMFWSHGHRIIGGAFSLMYRELIHGIIYISAFGCGLDSILIDLVERKAKEYRIPFMLLTIDEQTGEAGINTRVEAFLDMLEWRDINEDNIPTYG